LIGDDSIGKRCQGQFLIGYQVARIVPDTILFEADKRIARVLWNDPATAVMRHADAGYEEAVECADEMGLKLPMV